MPDGAVRLWKQIADLSVGAASMLIVLGVLAILLPRAVGIGVATVAAWIVIAGAIVHWTFVLYAFAAEKAGYALWRFLVAALYAVVGVYLALHPALGLATLTLLVGALFLSEGVLRTAAFLFFHARAVPGSGWILGDAMTNLVLGAVVLAGWPRDSAWAIGLLVGVDLVLCGAMRLMMSVAARRAIVAVAR